jgi:EAL domain-containing protein (putative c-di-GMP-specific phosphodiesterase class I)
MVAEGVEDADAQDLLAAWGCDLAQGYHIARPMPAADVLPWLRRTTTEARLARVTTLAGRGA